MLLASPVRLFWSLKNTRSKLHCAFTNHLHVMEMWILSAKWAPRTVDWEITYILEQNVDNPNLYLFLAVCKLASEFTTIFAQTDVCSDFAGVVSIFALRKLINVISLHHTAPRFSGIYKWMWNSNWFNNFKKKRDEIPRSTCLPNLKIRNIFVFLHWHVCYFVD